ncbi:MAG: hypothetical protein IPK75_16250 [Acidobacteria bacterium]|nr:hypothetical protein [Acidobacteriota bacterium]
MNASTGTSSLRTSSRVFEANVAPGLKASVNRRVLALTDFGQLFRRCCLDELGERADVHRL